MEKKKDHRIISLHFLEKNIENKAVFFSVMNTSTKLWKEMKTINGYVLLNTVRLNTIKNE